MAPSSLSGSSSLFSESLTTAPTISSLVSASVTPSDQKQAIDTVLSTDCATPGNPLKTDNTPTLPDPEFDKPGRL